MYFEHGDGRGRPRAQADRPARASGQHRVVGQGLMLPGAMALLSTPQGDVVFGDGTTELGTMNPPRADTHFRAASNTKTIRGSDRANGQEGSWVSTTGSRSMSKAFPTGTDYDQPAPQDAVRPLQIHHVPRGRTDQSERWPNLPLPLQRKPLQHPAAIRLAAGHPGSPQRSPRSRKTSRHVSDPFASIYEPRLSLTSMPAFLLWWRGPPKS